MKILKFVYRTSQTFSSDITDHYFTLRCLPREEARQKTLALRYRFWPQAGIVTSKDVFDNFVQKGKYCIHTMTLDLRQKELSE